MLESTFDAKQDYTTRVFDLNGNDLGVHDVYATSDYSLRLFGWSEIETLGKRAGKGSGTCWIELFLDSTP